LRPFRSICILAFALSLAAQTATQSTPQKKKVTPSTAKKTTAPAKAGTPVAKIAAGTKSGHATKSGTRTTKRASATRSRKSTPPRQQTPSADRYAEIQQALAAKGYFTGQANGVWGPDSIEAMKRFQADQKLPPDGKIGSLSLIALGLGPKHESGGEVAAKSQE
jgi:peptidoglycan hydrolase-like protein with peptidoglycan-binding domain